MSSSNGNGANGGADAGLPPLLLEVRDRAVALLTGVFTAGSSEALLRLGEQLVPRPEDFARAFLAEHADVAKRAYGTLWTTLPVPRPGPGQTRILAWAARPPELAAGGFLAERFPGGYKSLAERLVPDRVWVAWKFTKPGEPHGMAYDGLVWMDDHWAWFPKPWRLFR